MANEMVFVLDGDGDERAALGDMLDMEGLLPRLFDDAKDLLAAMEEDVPSLVIMDAPCPKGPDLALLSSLRGDRRWRRVSVIVFTGWRDMKFPARPDVRVVYKPDVEDLLAAIGAAITQARARMRPRIAARRAERYEHRDTTWMLESALHP